MKLCSMILSVVFLAILSLASGANTLGNETDKLSLVAFKSLIIQDPQRVLSSWNDSLHFCEWEGITCGRRHQRVISLNLSSKSLVGPISPHIGNLSFLRTLNLTDNSFRDDIPQQLGRLSRLRELILSQNSLVGRIPANISRCSNLKKLRTSYNNLVGEIPTELGSLTQIVSLNLQENMLTRSIPPSLGNLSSLEKLDLSFNSLNGSVPSALLGLKSLVVLSMGSNNLSGPFLPSFYNMSTLEVISLTDNHLSGNLPTTIGHTLPNIQLFFIVGNRFSGTIPASLFNASTILKMDLSYNQFTGRVPLNVGKLKEIQFLGLYGNHLGSGREGDLDFFTSLANCSNLQVFGIGENKFGGILPPSFSNFSNQLQKIYLNDNQIFGSIPTEIDKFPHLIFLSMSGNFFTGGIPKSIGNLQNLQVLSLYGNQLSGEIPSSLSNMSRLFFLNVSNNNLEGSIASSLGNRILQRLYLSYNRFIGTIPNREIALSVRLIELSLAHNSLNGSIPLEVANLKNLQYFDVSENNISGDIPSTLGGCLSLEFLYFHGNFFHGLVPSSSSLPKSLLEFDLSHNKIFGKIPRDLEKLSSLRLLNLSFNNIEGEVPTEGIFRNTSSFAIFGNQNLCGGIPMLGLPKCSIKTSKKAESHLALKLALGILFPLFMATFIFVIYMRRSHKPKLTSEQLPKDLMRVSYNDLYKATNGFSPDNLIGMGSYSSVYKGILPEKEGLVAVKVLNDMGHRAFKSFLAECEATREVRHRNLAKIITVCSSIDFNNNDFKALVFEHMPNGSLESWLYPSSNEKYLSLHQRINVAINVASALDYLHNHSARPIIHCDLKPSNILLRDDMIAQVTDFGLAKFISNVMLTQETNNDASNSITIRGTVGYIPPEYGVGVKVSAQGDVYSYGILLLELFTAKKPTDDMFRNGLSLHKYCKMSLPHEVMNILDVRLLSEGTFEPTHSGNQIKELLTSMMKIGVACSVEQVEERMDIKIALREIQSVKGLLRVREDFQG